MLVFLAESSLSLSGAKLASLDTVSDTTAKTRGDVLVSISLRHCRKPLHLVRFSQKSDCVMLVNAS